MLRDGEQEAYRHMENSLLADTRYYLSYMGLRKNQLAVLRRIRSYLERADSFPVQAERLAVLARDISRSFHEYNNALGLLEKTEWVKLEMRQQPLPATREEFGGQGCAVSGAAGAGTVLGAEAGICPGIEPGGYQRVLGKA